jgi:hypothetical protein
MCQGNQRHIIHGPTNKMETKQYNKAIETSMQHINDVEHKILIYMSFQVFFLIANSTKKTKMVHFPEAKT